MDFFLRRPFWQNLANIGLGFLVVCPLLALALHNHASAADDYCHIETVFNYGWFGGMKAYYMGWSGRYFSIFLNHSNPLIFHWFSGFKVIPFVWILGTVYALFVLIRTLNPRKDLWFNLGMAGVIFYLLILKLSSILEAFYWTAAVVNYTVPNALTILWIALSISLSKQVFRAGKVFGGLLSVFIVFLISGCSENNVFVIIILIAGWLGYRLIFHKKLDRFYLFLFIWSIFTALLSFMAPGNAVRLEGNPHSRDLVFAVISSFKFTPKLLIGWIFNPSLLLLTVLWIGVLPKILKRESGHSNPYFAVKPWYSLLVTGAIVISQIFPSYYGIGIDPTPRVINCIYFFFLLGWFYNIGVITAYFTRRGYMSMHNIPVIPFWGKAALFVLVCIHFGFSQNPRVVYREWLGGEAAAYDREMTERTNLLMTSTQDTVHVAPLKHKPTTLFLEDVTTNPKHLWNRCEAGYFGKKVIYLTDSPHQ
jgi:hypothetical protein